MSRLSRFSCFFAVLLLAAVPVRAQDVVPPPVMPTGEIVSEPLCFNVVNQAGYTVMGSFITDFYTTEDGQLARHKSNFRLEVGQQAEFCSYGPFFPERKLDLVVRTLVPVFECRTGINGDIVIQGKQRPDGGTDTWAVCL